MFGWFKKKFGDADQNDAEQSGKQDDEQAGDQAGEQNEKQDKQDKKRRYDRRQFLSGSFVRDAFDLPDEDSASTPASASSASKTPPPSTDPKSQSSQRSESNASHKRVDLLAVLGQLDPHSSERQMPPGVDEFNPRPRGTIPVIRPPGAVAEADFLDLCTLCDDCLHACPHDSIIRAPDRFREAAGTPMIDVLDNPCLMCADTPCISACETGALAAALSVEQPFDDQSPDEQSSDEQPANKQPSEHQPSEHQPTVKQAPGEQPPDAPPTYKIGVAMLQQYNCLAYNHSFCTVCAERCPEEAAIEINQGKPRIVAQHCTGCGICHSVCPAPMNAIMIMPNPNRPPAQRAD